MSVFTRLLLEQGHEIKLFDVEAARAREVAGRYSVNHSSSAQAAASDVDLILICASTEAVPEIIDEVKLHAKTGTIISEIASHKDKTIPALRRSAGIETLSIHPLFGPDISTLEGDRGGNCQRLSERDGDRESPLP